MFYGRSNIISYFYNNFTSIYVHTNRSAVNIHEINIEYCILGTFLFLHIEKTGSGRCFPLQATLDAYNLNSAHVIVYLTIPDHISSTVIVFRDAHTTTIPMRNSSIIGTFLVLFARHKNIGF